MSQVTVVGGGIGGLTAAIACAESGANVTLHEAHLTFGGRGRATAPPYVAHDGGHVFYAGGVDYGWLRERGFVDGLAWPSVADLAHVRFRVDGSDRRVPPAWVLWAQSQRWLSAPVEVEFGVWAAARWGETTARHVANMVAAVTYDANTAGLSAAFVWNLSQRIFGPRIPAIRWVRGGWQRVIDRMVTRAIELDVRLECNSRIDSLPDGPVIVATDLNSARKLLADDSLIGVSGHCVLMDFAVDYRRSDTTIGFDLDEGGFGESYSIRNELLAPPGQSLFQLQMPVREGESYALARARLQAFADSVVPGWDERALFRRQGVAKGRTGALDSPGRTWRDRPAIDRGGDRYLIGDMVAAPGMRGEIAVSSAIMAARSVSATLARIRRC